MIVISEIALKTLMSQIVEATHELADELGDRRIMATIPEAQLRIAAQVAIQIATGETVLAPDRSGRIVIKQDRRSRGVFDVRDE